MKTIKKISGCQGWKKGRKKWITEDFYTNDCVCNCNGGYTPLYTCLNPQHVQHQEWKTEEPGMLQSVGSQRAGHN